MRLRLLIVLHGGGGEATQTFTFIIFGKALDVIEERIVT